MKNSKFILCLPLALCVLASCGKAESVSQEEADMAKVLASAMQKGQEAYNGLAFETRFAQKFHIAYRSENENVLSTYSRDYDAEGSITMAYTLSLGEGESFNLGALYNQGSAYFSGAQKEISKINHIVTPKAGSNEPVRSLKEDYSYHHLFGIQFDGDTLLAKANDTLGDRIDESANRSDTFLGRIDKDAVDGYGSEALEASLGKILYLSTWSEVSSCRNAMTTYFKNLSLNSLDEASSFIRGNSVSFARENGSMKATFSLKCSDVFRYVLSKSINVEKRILCSVAIDEGKAILTQYEYDFKDVYAALLEQEKEGKKAFESTMESFVIRGKKLDMPADQLKLDGTFEEYSAEQASDFMEQVQEHVIPHPAKR